MEIVKFYIDPGHGGTDPGASGNGLLEKDITLKISKRIRAHLYDYKGASVRLSRETDKTLSLSERTNDANAWGADVLASIHTNAFNGEAHGYEDFIYDELSSSSRTNEIREIVHREVSEVNGLYNRGMKKANFHMLRDSAMPGLLTENGFIDNPSDAAKMKDDNWIDDVAKAHSDGLAKAFGLELKDYAKDNGSGSSDVSTSGGYKRLKTGPFLTARYLANSLDRVRDHFGWNFHYKADDLGYNPGIRIYTGRFTEDEVEEAAEALRDFTGWRVYIIDA